jgi:hypothetical protein
MEKREKMIITAMAIVILILCSLVAWYVTNKAWDSKIAETKKIGVLEGYDAAINDVITNVKVCKPILIFDKKQTTNATIIDVNCLQQK